MIRGRTFTSLFVGMVGREFERCMDFRFPRNTPETRKLWRQNFVMFHEPAFNIDITLFRNVDDIEASILRRKPENKWSAAEREYYKSYDDAKVMQEAREALDSMFAARHGAEKR